MRLSTRYGLLGIGALAILTTVHQLRERTRWSSPAADYLLGVLPNFAAALAITFVLLSIWTDHKRDAPFVSIQRWLLACSAVSVLGLLVWELIQRTSDRFVFDAGDIGATLLGACLTVPLLYAVTPRERRSA